MTEQGYKDWLLSLKEGDRVAINVGSYGFSNYVIVDIVRITPTRIIKTSDNRDFNNNGYERGSGRSAWSRHLKIEPVTDKIKEVIERIEHIRAIKAAKLEELSVEQLREIHWVITGGLE